MEHSCQQCGHEVEDGRPFCPQCRSPQIHVRVVIPEDVPLHPAADEPLAENVHTGYFDHADTVAGKAPPGMLPDGSTLDTRVAVRAVLKAAALGAPVAMLMPLPGIVLAGALVVFFYRRKSGPVLPVAFGVRLGAAAGAAAFAIYSAIFAIAIFVTHSQQKYLDDMLATARKLGPSQSDADFQASLHALLTPVGLAFAFCFGMIFAALLGSAGAALAALFLRRRKRHE